MDNRNRRRLKGAGVLGLALIAALALSRITDDGTMAAAPQDPFGYAERVSVDSEPLQFEGYDCTDDCSGHAAGWQWAEEQEIADPDDCGGNSESFIEGCIAYAAEHGEVAEDEGLAIGLY